MADNNTITNSNLPSSQQKSILKQIDVKTGNKHGNVIQRTTSESLRVGIASGGATSLDNQQQQNSVHPPTSLINQNDVNKSNSVGGGVPTPRERKQAKTSSFQITSVTVGTRGSADNGEDSADDLDESHTDDNSRITDQENETPSFSEDTSFSKEDVFFSSNPIGTAPVIPTSSQYGLAIVEPGMQCSSGQNSTDIHVSVTDAGINIVGNSCKQHDVDLHHRNERFKVVKIESTEPFKRGRWICMDYLDHTTLQQSPTPASSNSVVSVKEPDGTTTTNDSGIVVNENNLDPTDIIKNDNLLAGQSLPPGLPTTPSISPGQSLHTVGDVNNSHSPSSSAGAAAVIIPNHVQSMINVPLNANQSTVVVQPQPTPPVVEPTTVSQQPPPQQQQQQQNPTPNVVNNVQGQSQPAQYYQQSIQQTPQHHQGATLPANILHQISQQHPDNNVVPTVSIDGQTPFQIQPTSQVTVEQPIVSVNQQEQSPPQSAVIQQDQASNQTNVSTTTSTPAVATAASTTTTTTSSDNSDFIINPLPPPTLNSLITNSENLVSSVNENNSENSILVLPSNNSGGNTITTAINAELTTTPSSQKFLEDGVNQLSQLQTQQQQGAGIEDGQSTEDSESFSGLALALSASHQRFSSTNLNNNMHQHHHQHHHHHHRHHSKHQDDNIYTNIALGNCIQNLMNSKCESVGLIDQKEFGIPIPKNNRRNYDNSSQQSSPGSGFFCGSPISPSQIYSTGNVTPSGQLGVFSSRISRAASPQRPTINCPDHQSASGTSAVAIDNKIEQAMDLVKSHLMFAVREEVEVLKEKIAELMDRINQLEIENSFLKANATQETLTQLSATVPTPKIPPTNPANGPV